MAKATGKDPEGTSPRMRGKLGVTKTQLNQVRNIPAYAGKTRQQSSQPYS